MGSENKLTEDKIIQNSVITSLQQIVYETDQAYSEFKDNVISRLERRENENIIAQVNQ